MSIPNNIYKNHILKAIEKINLEGVPKDADSQYYDVVYENKRYPPKLIISYANLFANGHKLDRNSFSGGLNTQCFKLLSENGFVIVNKSNNSPYMTNVWIEKTIVNGRPDRTIGDRSLGKALWSPTRDQRGADIYKNMREVNAGDIIIHLVNNSLFIGASIVKKKAIETGGVEGTNWTGPAYLIELNEYIELSPAIDRSEILNEKYKEELNTISKKSEVFFTSNLNLRQGAYLTPCPKELLEIINNIYLNKSGKYLPHMEAFNLKNYTAKATGFNILKLQESLSNSGLYFTNELVIRFIASLLTKPYIILTGLSGSGKTKLAQAFVKWICESNNQYCLVPVGADWTNREPLLGYPNAINPKEYVKPDSGVLDLILQANNQPDYPHFLILDEMNLSHVERYFADFLSAMESKEEIPLYAEGSVENGVPSKLKVPSNLYIIGTVNIDETTNMFSPKVLDRANTIEFRVTQDEMKNFLDNIKDINLDVLNGKGAEMAKSFLAMSANKSFANADTIAINNALVQFFGELKKTGAEFGYRSATEMLRLINQLNVLDSSLEQNQKIDIAIMQKLLPKLHGSRRKLCPILETLGSFCVSDDLRIVKDVFENIEFDFKGTNVLYSLSLEKIARMYKGAIDNGFASFAEA